MIARLSHFIRQKSVYVCHFRRLVYAMKCSTQERSFSQMHQSIQVIDENHSLLHADFD